MPARLTCTFFKFILAGSLVFLSQFTHAQSIASWNFNGNLNGVAGSFNTVSSADFSGAVPAKAFNAGSEYYGQDGWPVATLNPTLYLSFTLTPNPGYALNISSIDLRMRHSNTGSSGGSGPTQFTLRSSLDGYNADLGSGSLTGAYANFVINPGAAFNNLPTAVTFRVYGHHAVMFTGGNNRLVFDNINVDAIGIILPAKLIALRAYEENNGVMLKYQLNDLSAGSHVLVERSVDNMNYAIVHEDRIADLKLSENFTFYDLPRSANSIFYYRLKIISPTGQYIYSPVSTVELRGEKTIQVVWISRRKLRVNNVCAGAVVVCLYDAMGRPVLVKPLNRTSINTPVELDLPALPNGVYYLLFKSVAGNTPVVIIL